MPAIKIFRHQLQITCISLLSFFMVTSMYLNIVKRINRGHWKPTALNTNKNCWNQTSVQSINQSIKSQVFRHW